MSELACETVHTAIRIVAPGCAPIPLHDGRLRPEIERAAAGSVERGGDAGAPLRQDLDRLRGIWEDCQASRDRNAIYGYLTAVYGLVAWWTAEGREIDRARRALRLQRLAVSGREDPFASVIRCTADPAKADKRTRSKWSRALRYAAAYKSDSELLAEFIRRKAASTPALLGSPGGLVQVRRGGRQEGHESPDARNIHQPADVVAAARPNPRARIRCNRSG
jgi:hypothetical protein